MRLLRILDALVLRSPFEPAQARRYARQRAALGDLDQRLADRLAPVLAPARRVLDVGAGAGELARVLAARHPHLSIVTLEPGHGFHPTLRGRAEAIPLTTAAVDLAIGLSSLRHARRRQVALAELRRVVRPGGQAVIVELDPAADEVRRARHLAAMPCGLPRLSFRLGLAIAPPIEALAALARRAGWETVRSEPDPEQPLAILWLR